MGRPPTVSAVNVQLKPVISSHDVGSIHVSFASEGTSLKLEHAVDVLVAVDEGIDDALEVTVEEPEGRIEEPELSVGEPGVPDADAEVVEDKSGFSATATGAGVNFE